MSSLDEEKLLFDPRLLQFCTISISEDGNQLILTGGGMRTTYHRRICHWSVVVDVWVNFRDWNVEKGKEVYEQENVHLAYGLDVTKEMERFWNLAIQDLSKKSSTRRTSRQTQVLERFNRVLDTMGNWFED